MHSRLQSLDPHIRRPDLVLIPPSVLLLMQQITLRIDAAINLAIRAGVWMCSLRRMRSLLIIGRALERMQPH